EREDSRQRRLAAMALRRAQPHPAALVKGRPTKKDRRLIHRFTGD
ncbi:MAG: RNA-binding S4 domain-containing protein, partial [Betaproteobacteria bacterium]|nr:RNA-binding S4 domain-containing protein [Betaproteobacteria bacterium]